MKILLLLAAAGLLYILQDLIYKTFWDKNLSVSIHFQDKAVLEGEQATLTEVIENRKLLPLAESDRRIGYHIEAHAYLFTPEQIRKKIETLQKIKENHHEVFELEKSDPAAGAPELPVRCYGCK